MEDCITSERRRRRRRNVNSFNKSTNARNPVSSAIRKALWLPGDSKNIEKTIIDKTAEITSSAMQIPRQFLFSVDDIASSCGKRKRESLIKRR